MTLTVTTWYLEQRSPEEQLPATHPGDQVSVVRAEAPSPDFSRYLYSAVGGDIRWTDRLVLTREEWERELARPGTETWVAHERGTPAGYVELAPSAPGEVEIVYFGLLPDFRGRRIGGHLLATGAARAWDLAGRWPGLEPTRRVWLHTCSKDGKHAVANYRRRGFSLYGTEVTEEAEVSAPPIWPEATGSS